MTLFMILFVAVLIIELVTIGSSVTLQKADTPQPETQL